MAAFDRPVRDMGRSDYSVRQLLGPNAAFLQLLASDRAIQKLGAGYAAVGQMLACYRTRSKFGRSYRLVREMDALYRVILKPERANAAMLQLRTINAPWSDLGPGYRSIRQIVGIDSPFDPFRLAEERAIRLQAFQYILDVRIGDCPIRLGVCRQVREDVVRSPAVHRVGLHFCSCRCMKHELLKILFLHQFRLGVRRRFGGS
ncbi:hypothetical protein D3C73_1143510 [compost metagenome]